MQSSIKSSIIADQGLSWTGILFYIKKNIDIIGTKSARRILSLVSTWFTMCKRSSIFN